MRLLLAILLLASAALADDAKQAARDFHDAVKLHGIDNDECHDRGDSHRPKHTCRFGPPDDFHADPNNDGPPERRQIGVTVEWRT